ncbi:hypothetical protein R6Q57_013082 [Mikania cordata]
MPEEELEKSSLAAKLNGYAAELCPPRIQSRIDGKINEIIRKGWPILRDVRTEPLAHQPPIPEKNPNQAPAQKHDDERPVKPDWIKNRTYDLDLLSLPFPPFHRHNGAKHRMKNTTNPKSAKSSPIMPSFTEVESIFAADLIGHNGSGGLYGYIGDMDKAAATSLWYFLPERSLL